jgi:hypothetical protein
MLWHAFMFLGLRFFPPFFFLLGGLRSLFFLLEFKLLVFHTMTIICIHTTSVSNQNSFLQEKAAKATNQTKKI